ncbi:hypothetical protein D3C72_729770 [compost metagenome]
MWVAVYAPLRIRNSHELQEFENACTRLSFAATFVVDDRFGDLRAYPVEGIERGHRLLENHGDFRAADVVQFADRQTDQLAPAIFCRALNNAVGCKQPHDAHHGLAFAGTGFADNGERFPRFDVKIDAFNGIHRAIRRGEIDLEIADGEDGFRCLGHINDPWDRAHHATHRPRN